MNITAGVFEAVFAGVSLLIYFTATMIGGVVFILGRIEKAKNEILTDVKSRHEENRLRVDILQQLVIRHDAWLNPEYDGPGNHYSRRP